MLSGGPAFPLATPGVRVAVKPTEQITWQTAVFSGNPAGANCNDNPQACNRYGTTFSFTGGALWMSELQYAVNQEKNAKGLPGIYKLGGWYATADFADQHYGLDGCRQCRVARRSDAAGPAQSSRRLGHLRHRRSDGLARGQDQPELSSCAAAWRPPTAI